MTEEKKGFKGIYSALLTPYDENGKINFKVIRQLVEYQLRGGVSGFFVMGTSSEMLLLGENERKKVIETVVDAVAGRARVIAQTGCLSTDEAISMSKFAVETGADAFSAIPPVYFRYRREEIINYYREVALSVELPFFAYNIPVCTGIDLLDKQYRPIFELPNLIGWKESSAHCKKMKEILREYPDKIMLEGNDYYVAETLSFGGKGAIGSTYNLIPAPFVQICKFAENGEFQKAEKLQRDLNDVIEILDFYGGIPAVKSVLTDMGYPMGPCRKPFRKLSDQEKQELRIRLKGYMEKYAQ